MGDVMPLSDAGPMSPDARRRRTAGLMAAQFDRPTPQDTAVVERGGLLPFGTYANGMTGPAIPGFITQPFESATTGDLLFANGGRPGAAVGQLIQQYGYGAPFGALPDYRDVI